MPEKFDDSGVRFSISPPGVPLKFYGIETVDCPRCRYLIPVRPEFTDNRILADRTIKYANELEAEFTKMLDDMEDKIPGVAVYMTGVRFEWAKTLDRLRKAVANQRGNQA